MMYTLFCSLTAPDPLSLSIIPSGSWVVAVSRLIIFFLFLRGIKLSVAVGSAHGVSILDETLFRHKVRSSLESLFEIHLLFLFLVQAE